MTEEQVDQTKNKIRSVLSIAEDDSATLEEVRSALKLAAALLAKAGIEDMDDAFEAAFISAYLRYPGCLDEEIEAGEAATQGESTTQPQLPSFSDPTVSYEPDYDGETLFSRLKAASITVLGCLGVGLAIYFYDPQIFVTALEWAKTVGFWALIIIGIIALGAVISIMDGAGGDAEFHAYHDSSPKEAPDTLQQLQRTAELDRERQRQISQRQIEQNMERARKFADEGRRRAEVARDREFRRMNNY